MQYIKLDHLFENRYDLGVEHVYICLLYTSDAADE